MRTNIIINDQLMKEALKLSGASTKREVVETALRLLVSLKLQESTRSLRGKLKWTGDLNRIRQD